MHPPTARHPISWLAFILAGATLAAAGGGPAPVLDLDTAVHIANRLTFGATAATVERLRADGLDGWLASQLRSDRQPDPALEARLATLTTLTLSPRELAETYYLPALERRRAMQGRMQSEGASPGPAVSVPGQPDAAMPRRADGQRAARQVLIELTTQKLVRTTTAERQLEEVLVDFWFNHFNVFADKGPVRQYAYDFERSAIRPHVLGSFRTMLGAVAGHPAMLFYLDNWQSSAAGTRVRGTTGLNENYGRELLELHTLGVDGGYSQADIVAVARAFTGWTIRGPRQGGEAIFDGRRHDRDAKSVLRQSIPAGGGREDGERVLDLVARHPATARHIARKLAIRFVSDTPPEALVSRVAARFAQTDGDLRATIETLVKSPEFVAPQARLSKVKTPLEFVTSAVRVLDADIAGGGGLGQELRTLGMAPYFAQPPTGYSDRADAWTNAGSLVQRMNIAVALTSGRMRGVGAPVVPVVEGDTAEARARAMARALLLRDASAATIRTVAQAKTPQDMAALILGSPEFQRR
jgi:uncharacterized protein (DUF1800 family)